MGTVIKLFPLILQSIIAVNDLVRGYKKGSTRKKLVMDAVVLGTNITGEAGATLKNSHMQAISQLIDATVKTLNEGGLFGSDEDAKVGDAIVEIQTKQSNSLDAALSQL